MLKLFLAAGLAFVVALAFILVIPVAEGQRVVVVNDGLRPQSGKGKVLPEEYIVRLKQSYTNATHEPDDTKKVKEDKIKVQVQKKAKAYNATRGFLSLKQKQGGGAYVDEVYTLAVQGFTAKKIKNPFLFASDPHVQSIEPNIALPKDTQYMPRGLDRIDVDLATTTTYRPDKRETKLDVDVAVLDTTVHDHPDLNIFTKRFYVDQPDATLETHGTHVAGTCCARDNLGGVVGVAQGARIWSLQVCGGSNGLCPSSDRLAAFDFVIANAAAIEVATMSCCGGGGESSTVETAVTNVINSGVTFTRSAGNTGTVCESDWGCDHPTAIVVANLYDTDGKCGGLGPTLTSSAGITARDDTVALSSTWGSQIDIMAPGSFILSSYPAGLAGFDAVLGGQRVDRAYPYIGGFIQDGYAVIGGTSMSTPHVAGVAALISINNPSFTHAQVKSDIQTNAYSQTQACDGFGKGGLVSGANAKGSFKILYAKNY